MFDFAQKMQRALADRARGVGLKAAGGLVAAVALGFLLAALWSFLAHNLDWGPALASLVIGGVLVALAAGLMVASKPRHQMPTTDELKREVEARVSLATDVAVDRARLEAARMVDMAGNKANALMDEAGYRAAKLAGDAERKVFGGVRETARAIGLTTETTRDAKRQIRNAKAGATRAANTNAGSMAKLIGAFAVGVTLASAISDRRNSAQDFDEDDLL
ncbi:MAG: phage holin family protein [Paracoccus sp. (in: a-proteobacteria)]